ncbi:MAG TPA: hypothetical protein VNL39_09535 [Xanthobacteraceae bacterium]|nr:hypothetical protein [Xanthobacteraceae bacterium]
MRKVLLISLAVAGVSLFATMSNSATPGTGAAALLNAAQECATANVEEVAWRCRRRCYWRAGVRHCRRVCHRI